MPITSGRDKPPERTYSIDSGKVGVMPEPEGVKITPQGMSMWEQVIITVVAIGLGIGIAVVLFW